MDDAIAQYRLRVNGVTRDLSTDASATLLEVLRRDLELTGTKYNCEQGECGACTVLVDRTAVNSCIVLAVSLDDREIVTIEGLRNELGVDLQDAFIEFDAAQCGYCTPGMVMASRALLERNPKPSQAEIRSGLEGNYCRCTGYAFIVEAVAEAASRQPQDNRPGTGDTGDHAAPSRQRGDKVEAPADHEGDGRP